MNQTMSVQEKTRRRRQRFPVAQAAVNAMLPPLDYQTEIILAQCALAFVEGTADHDPLVMSVAALEQATKAAMREHALPFITRAMSLGVDMPEILARWFRAVWSLEGRYEGEAGS